MNKNSYVNKHHICQKEDVSVPHSYIYSTKTFKRTNNSFTNKLFLFPFLITYGAYYEHGKNSARDGPVIRPLLLLLLVMVPVPAIPPFRAIIARPAPVSIARLVPGAFALGAAKVPFVFVIPADVDSGQGIRTTVYHTPVKVRPVSSAE